MLGPGLPTWVRSKNGYVWDENAKLVRDSRTDPLLFSRPGQKLLVQRRYAHPVRYSPKTDHPGLYREFAALHASLRIVDDMDELTDVAEGAANRFEIETAAFAAKYGFLEIGVTLAPPRLSIEDQRRRYAITTQGPGESIFDWWDHVLSVSYLTALWDLVRAYREHPHRLNSLVEIQEEGGSRFESGDAGLMVVAGVQSRLVRPDFKAVRFFYAPSTLPRGQSDDYDPDMGFHIPSEAIESQAKEALRFELNEKLLDHPAVIQLAQLTRSRKQTLRLYPATLIGAIYAQLSEEVVGGRALRCCEHCETWFTPARSDAKYCSDRCRTASHRAG